MSNPANPEITNSFCEHPVDLSQDDILSLAGFTMVGPGLGKAVRERFIVTAGSIFRNHGPRAFEMPKRAAAIHEAGHVVINSVLGVQTTKVLIDSITRGGKLFWIGYTDAPNLAFVDSPASPVSFDHILRRSRATYAGLAAELIFAGDDRREGSSLDEIIMSQLLAERAASLVGLSAPTLWRDEVAAWCNIHLRCNHKAHVKITTALMNRGRLKGKVLRELCAEVLPSAAKEDFPDIQDHTTQLFNAGIITEDAEVWA